MENISNVLFWISNGFLAPVIVGLIFLFLKSVFLLGGFYAQYIQRRKVEHKIRPVFKELDFNGLGRLMEELKEGKDLGNFVELVRRIVEPGIGMAKINFMVSEYEISLDKDLSSPKILTKFGPILGLMGTLIPMGPALVGLSSGDIASMAHNMQVAFATTVIGLFCGGVGFVALHIRQRWNARDMSRLDYITELIEEETGYGKKA